MSRCGGRSDAKRPVGAIAHDGARRCRRRRSDEPTREEDAKAAAETCHSAACLHHSSMGRAHASVNFFGASRSLLLARARARAPPTPTAVRTLQAADRRAAPHRRQGRAARRARASRSCRSRTRAAPRTLDFLQAGLPALVAERLGRHPGLRFAGPETIVERTRLDDALTRAAATGTPFVVAGRYEKKPNWKIAVTVEIYAGATPANRLGDGRGRGHQGRRRALGAAGGAGRLRAGGRRDAGRVARGRVLEPFARDAYAFVLYGRGVAVYTGLDQPWDPTSGAAGRSAAPAASRRPPCWARNAERALKPLGKSLLIDPRVPETRRYVGLVHLGAGRPGHARAMWSYAVDVRPDYTAAVLGLAMLDRTQGLPEARDALRARARARPRRSRGAPHLRRAPVRRRPARRGPGAARGASSPRRPATCARAARSPSCSRRGTPAPSSPRSSPRSCRLDPEDLDARLELGAAYASIGNVDAALELVRGGAAAPPQEHRRAQGRRRSLPDEGRAGEGRRLLREAAPHGARRPAPVVPAGRVLLRGRPPRRRRAHVHRGRALPRHARRRLLEPGRHRLPPRPRQGGHLVPLARRHAPPGQGGRPLQLRARARRPSSATTTPSARSPPPPPPRPRTPRSASSAASSRCAWAASPTPRRRSRRRCASTRTTRTRSTTSLLLDVAAPRRGVVAARGRC